MSCMSTRAGWLIACLAIGTATGPSDARERFYRKVGPLGGSGYSDKRIAPNRWRIRSKAVNRRGEDVALPLAMYRAALVTKRAGFPYMQIVKTNLSVWEAFAAHSQDAELTVTGASAQDAPLVCENKGRDAQACRTLPSDEAMRMAGAALGHSPAEMAEDLAATPAG